MKPFKYSSVFRRVEEGSRALIAHEGSEGYSFMVTQSHMELGLIYRGMHNRAFLRDLKKDKHWSLRTEMEPAEFSAAVVQAFTTTTDDDTKRIDPEQLKAAVDYTAMPVDGRSNNILLSMLWLVDGALYGTDGHRMHRVKRAVREKSGTVFGISPCLLKAFLAAVLHHKPSAWAGVIYDKEEMRLIGGNEQISVWLRIGAIEQKKVHESLVGFFQQGENNFDQLVEMGALLVEERPGVLLEALETAPVFGDVVEAVGFRVYPDAIRHTIDKEFTLDKTLPPVNPIKLMPGSGFVEKGDYFGVVVNPKYLKQALAFPGRAVVLLQSMDFLWMGDTDHTAVLMPIKP